MSTPLRPFHLQLRRRIAAPRERVFEAWTRAEEIARWMSGPSLEIARAVFEPRVGGELCIDMRMRGTGRVYEHTGKVLELRAPELLRFTWISAGTGFGESLVTLEFHAAGAATELVLTHEKLPNDDEARSHAEGWGAFLDWLARDLGTSAFSLEESIEVLRRTPAVIAALAYELPPAWLFVDEGPGTWTPHDILGHLIHGERTDWIPRARRLLEHGEARAFEPFDREGHRQELGCITFATLVGVFAEERAKSLAALADLRIGEAELERRGRHPVLGPVTLQNLLATWVVHDLGHIAQFARVMAKRYAGEVGPWRVYLPVLSDRAK